MSQVRVLAHFCTSLVTAPHRLSGWAYRCSSPTAVRQTYSDEKLRTLRCTVILIAPPIQRCKACLKLSVIATRDACEADMEQALFQSKLRWYTTSDRRNTCYNGTFRFLSYLSVYCSRLPRPVLGVTWSNWTFLLPASDHKELQGSEQQHKHDAIYQHDRC